MRRRLSSLRFRATGLMNRHSLSMAPARGVKRARSGRAATEGRLARRCPRVTVYLGLGSNLGDREAAPRARPGRACARAASTMTARELALPDGARGRPAPGAVPEPGGARERPTLAPEALLAGGLEAEAELGRVRTRAQRPAHPRRRHPLLRRPRAPHGRLDPAPSAAPRAALRARAPGRDRARPRAIPSWAGPSRELLARLPRPLAWSRSWPGRAVAR